jgi:putative endonuclease
MNYYCYLLSNHLGNTYIGITNNLQTRLDQHNGIIAGGAKATKKANTWKFERVVGTFNKGDAMSFEWYWKHTQSANGKWYHTKSGIGNKLKRLDELMRQDNWLYVLIYL